MLFPHKISPWKWIPSLYFAQGIPYVTVMTIAVIFYKRMEISNTDIALYTSWLYLPWVLKPLWSPFIDILKTKRWWIISMQILIGAGLAGVAFCIPASLFFQATLAFFWLLAFASATHDIAADGFYMLALNSHEQSLYVGIRNTFYRIAMISGQGLLIMLAGILEIHTENISLAWSITFFILSGIFIMICLYHKYILPYPPEDKVSGNIYTAKTIWKEFLQTFISFFKKKEIVSGLFFMLTFRLSESQLLKLASPFMLDPKEAGGLELTTGEVGLVYGTVGVLALTIGGIIGGIVASRQGLKFWLWPMTLAITLPNLVYVYLSYLQPNNLILINSAVAIEQFGYGFGFTAYMLYMISFANGKHKTAHYAICTAFMALGMMLPGMIAGWLQDMIGYKQFFIWVMICTLPAYLSVAFLKVDPKFGKK
ncbi:MULTISPECIES: MFS transporter [Bacteroidales]|uniref:MFS transporter n=1 Tax=Bacteroidales TaxID=171549 RepID=UPI000574D413|nr:MULTISPECIES: MFS transporter [Bacteroidales]KHM48740.1 beta-lactamase [Coprobacter secundus]